MKHDIPTPRTDNLSLECNNSWQCKNGYYTTAYCSAMALSRQLERELHETKARFEMQTKLRAEDMLKDENIIAALRAELAQHQPAVRSTEE